MRMDAHRQGRHCRPSRSMATFAAAVPRGFTAGFTDGIARCQDSELRVAGSHRRSCRSDAFSWSIYFHPQKLLTALQLCQAFCEVAVCIHCGAGRFLRRRRCRAGQPQANLQAMLVLQSAGLGFPPFPPEVC